MTLAELVREHQLVRQTNFSTEVVRRTPSLELARRVFEEFRSINYLVGEVLEGKTTFAEVFDTTIGRKFRLPFTAKSEDELVLRYLLTVPRATVGIEELETISQHPDYNHSQQMRFARLNSRLVNASKASKVLTWAGGFAFLAQFGACARSVNTNSTYYFDTALGGMAGVLVGTYFLYKAYQKKKKDLRQMAVELDTLVEQVYHLQLDGARITRQERLRIASQHNWIADAHVAHERYLEAAKELVVAIKNQPLDLRSWGKAVSALSLGSDFKSLYWLLNQAQVLFPGELKEPDIVASQLYQRKLESENKPEVGMRVVRAAVDRLGISYCNKWLEREKSVKEGRATGSSS